MSYRPIVDKDEEHAKECLDCGKIFYVGEECPFCSKDKNQKQNLFKSFCPDCKKKAKNIIGWVKVVNKSALPGNLPEERCPECVLDVLNSDCCANSLVF